ncbi:hypothetical protein Barb7_02627 [Bacteroidales bacterium Barb7]|nr:hypothetical protein Barb7_02627 [Bacteroidales bacterium Barb7]
MRQPIMHKDAARKREYLRLILQPSEGGREDKAVIIPLEIGTVMFPLSIGFHTETLVGQELCPLHLILI